MCFIVFPCSEVQGDWYLPSVETAIGISGRMPVARNERDLRISLNGLYYIYRLSELVVRALIVKRVWENKERYCSRDL